MARWLIGCEGRGEIGGADDSGVTSRWRCRCLDGGAAAFVPPRPGHACLDGDDRAARVFGACEFRGPACMHHRRKRSGDRAIPARDVPATASSARVGGGRHRRGISADPPREPRSGGSSSTSTYLAWILKLLLVWTACLLATRSVFGLAVRHRLFARRLIVVGTGKRAARLADVIRSKPGTSFDLVRCAGGGDADQATMPVPNDWRSVWGIVVAAEAGEAIPSGMLLDGKRRGVRVLDDVTFLGAALRPHRPRSPRPRLAPLRGRLRVEPVRCGSEARERRRRGGHPLLPDMAGHGGGGALREARLPGPLLYRQERVGLHGRAFTVAQVPQHAHRCRGRRHAALGGATRPARHARRQRSSGSPGSTNCRSCSTCCAAR